MKRYGIIRLFLIFLAIKFQSMSATDKLDKKEFDYLFKIHVKEDAHLVNLRNQLDLASKDHTYKDHTYKDCTAESENPKIRIQQLQLLNGIEKEYNSHYNNLIKKFNILWQQEKNPCLSSDLLINDETNKEETKIISPP